MVTHDEKLNAITRMATRAEFNDKVRTAIRYVGEAFDSIVTENDMRNKSVMAMNIAYLTLYLEAVQHRYNIPSPSVDGWVDAFVRGENGGM